MNDPQSGGPGPSRRAVLRAAGGVALTGTMGTGPSEAGGGDGPQEKPAGGPAIDIHVHVTTPRLPGLKPKPKGVDRLYAGPIEPLAARLRPVMEQAAVSVALGMEALAAPTRTRSGSARSSGSPRSSPT